MNFLTSRLGQIAVVSVLLASVGLILGVSFAASCAVLAALYFAMQRHIEKFSKTQKWLLAVASVVLVAPGNPWITLFVAGIIATCFLFKNVSLQATYVAGLGCLAVLTTLGVLAPEYAFADEGLSSLINRIKEVANSAQAAAPYFGYAAGLGFGGSGLIEVVKSKNGQGGDFGSGMKKVLIGGGLASISAILDMASTDMGGSGTNTGKNG